MCLRVAAVLRYSKEELLALHVPNTEAPTFPPETVVASDHALPPVSTLPFDYEEIYKQWALNRNRGRGRGRGNANGSTTNNQAAGGEPSDRARTDSKWEDGKPGKVPIPRCSCAVVYEARVNGSLAAAIGRKETNRKARAPPGSAELAWLQTVGTMCGTTLAALEATTRMKWCVNCVRSYCVLTLSAAEWSCVWRFP